MSIATVVPPGQGDKFFIVGDHITFKIRAAETGGKYTVAVTHIPVNSGPPPHVHAAEDELFYVLEGTMAFMGDTHTFTAGAGSAVFLPRNKPHTFRNVGDAPARFILSVCPAGFENFIAACGTPITQIPSGLPVDDAAIGKLLQHCQTYGVTILPNHKPVGEKSFPDKSRSLWVLGELVTIKLDSTDTNGQFCVAEVTSHPGGGVPAHRHRDIEEYFYVLEGDYEFTLDGQRHNAPVGTFIHVPADVSHGFRNVGQSIAKLVDFHTPGKFDQFFKECGIDCHDITAPPKVAPPDMQQLRALFNKHGMDLT